MISDWIAGIFLMLGSVFMLLASVGLIRLPDLYMRMHSTTKAPAMGLLLLLTALCVQFPQISVIIKSVLIILFIFMTTPVASHMIARAAYMMKTKKWKNTLFDDWEKYWNGH